MKRCIALLWLCVFLLTSCGKSADPFLTVPTDREGTLVVYTLDREAYYQFMDAPSFEWLQADHAEALSLYTMATDNTEEIEVRRRNDGINQTSRIEHGTTWIHNIRLCRNLITFGGSAQAIGAYLQQNGIQDTVNDYCLVNCEYFPVALWVNTVDGDYVITFNEYIEDYEEHIVNDTWREDYVYRLYDHETFIQKVLPTDGTVVVGDASVVSTVIHTDYAEIPMIAVMKSLGATVKTRWNNRVEFALEDQTVIVDHKKSMYNDEHFILPGGHGFCEYADDELLLDDNSAQQMLDVWGIDVTVDREQGIVRITKGQ